MKEYYGIVKQILVNENDIDNNITFNIEVNNNILSISLTQTPLVSNIYVGDHVLVTEDIILGKKVYEINSDVGDNYV